MTVKRILAAVLLLCLVFPLPGAQAQSDALYLRIAHLAPSAPAGAVSINSRVVAENLRFKEVTQYVPVESASVEVTFAWAETAAERPYTVTLDLAGCASGYYTAVAVGSPADGSFEVFLLPQDGEEVCPVPLPDVLMLPGEGASGNIRISGAFARATSHHGGMTGVSAAYMTLENTGEKPDRLLSASTDAAGKVEIHETLVENDKARMQMLPDGIEIPAGGSVALQPGGLHIMLMQLTRDLLPGQTITLTLKFESGTEVTLSVPIRAPVQ